MTEVASPAAPDSLQLAGLLARRGHRFDVAALSLAVQGLAPQYLVRSGAEWLRAVAVRAGLPHLRAVAVDVRRADPAMLPALAWHGGHWQLLIEVSPRGCVLEDGGGRHQRLAVDELAAAPVICVHSPAGAAGAPSDLPTRSPAARLVVGELLRHPGWIVQVMLATIAVNVLAVATSLFSMQVYDRVVPTFAYATLATLTAGMGIVFALDALLKQARAAILDRVAVTVDSRASQQVFAHLLDTELDARPRSVGSFAAQVGSLESVRQFLSSTVIFGLVDLPFCLLFLALIALIGGPVAWVYALLLPVGLVAAWAVHRRLRRLVQSQMAQGNERQGVLVDAIRGAEAIRAAGAGWRFAREWRNVTEGLAALSMRQKGTHNTLSIIIGLLSSIAYVAAIVVGVWQVEGGHFGMGGMVACSLLGGRVITPLMQGIQYLVQWEQVRQSLRMVDQVLALPLQRRPDQALLAPSLASADIAAEQVTHQYPGAALGLRLPPLLQFRSGERVLLLGPVGSGKSTLLKLLGGLYRPSTGQVRVAGIDLWEIDPQALAGLIGYLPQEPQLFKGTLYENLLLSTVVPDAEAQALARALGIDQIAAGSSLGMNLRIGEGGVGLSGGQRQLVALGRMMLSAPRLWLLDEPTASLDADSEARLWKTLEQRLRPDDILLVATHKPGHALRLATRVLVMRGGEVVRDGQPAELFPRAFPGSGAAAADTGAAAPAAASAGGRHAG